MAAVTKSSGKYFYENDRVWKEAAETGVEPFFVGDWKGAAKLPAKPTPDLVKDLSEGSKYLSRVQSNRVGGFDVSFTFGKSVSIVLYGLTPTSKWKESADKLVAATRPEVEWLVDNQRANDGPQGERKVKSQGGCVGFSHWLSSFGDVNGHMQYWVPNLTARTPAQPNAPSTISSIANAHEMYDRQAVMRARANKRLDDSLQAEGYRTVLEGHVVGIAGIPAEMARELSAALRAMDEAKTQKGFSGAKAQDHYARQARRQAGRGPRPTPQQAVDRVHAVAKRYGVTPDKLKRPAGTPAAAQDKHTAMSTAYDVAVRARDECATKFGAFTASQFQERLYTLGIGKPTTLDALDTTGKVALAKRDFIGIALQHEPDGTVRYITEKSAGATKAAEQPYRPDTAEAWADLKKAARGLGAAVLVKTAQAGVGVLTRLAEAVNPPPRTVVIDAKDLAGFISTHRPTPYLLAHAKALLKGAMSPGNPHEKAGAAEKVYRSLRQHARVRKNTVLVVEGARHASARELHQLAKIARRDKACVVLSDRSGGGRGGPGGQQQGHQHQTSHHLGRP